MAPPLPTFIIAGATRSGTSSLHAYLSAHPEIFMSRTKEVRFFAKDALYARGLPYYRRYFKGHRGEPAVGEATPMYMHTGLLYGADGVRCYYPNDSAIQRIRESLGKVKLILTLRDPVKRAFSIYWKNYLLGKSDFQLYLLDIIRQYEEFGDDSADLVYFNRYAVHLDHILAVMPPENVKILIFEEWTREVTGTVSELAAFLGVDSARVPPMDGRVHNAGARYRVQRWMPGAGWLGRAAERALGQRRHAHAPPDPAAEARLRHILAPDVAHVERVLGRRIPAWHPEEAA